MLINQLLRFRLPILVGIILLTVFFTYQLTKLRIDSDILNYLPEDDPIVIKFQDVGDLFGGNSLAMVALETDNVFTPQTLTRIDNLTKSFKELPEISQVISLTDILDIRKIPDGIEVGKLIPRGQIPQDPSELATLRDYTLSKDMYSGNLVSEDGTIAPIIVRIREGANKSEVAENMKRIVNETQGSERIYYAGIAFQMVFLTDIITRDLAKLVPLVTLLVIAVLFAGFRRKRGVMLPLGTVLISTIWTLGLMSLMGMKLTIVAAAIPVLLIAIGSAYGIHLFSKYVEESENDDSATSAVLINRTLSKVGLPIIMAGVTTLIGFLAFIFSYLTMIRSFGAFASLGVFLAMIMSLVFIPIILSYLSPLKVRKPRKESHSNLMTRMMDSISDFVLGHERLIVAGGVLLLIAAAIAIPKLQREVNIVEYFKKDSEIRMAEDMMQANLGGSVPIQILVEGEIKNPLVLKQIHALEKYLRTLPDVNSPQSIADLIVELNDKLNGRRAIPDTRQGVANLWFFIEGNKVMDQLVAENDTQALIQAKLGTVNTARLITVVDSIDSYIQREMITDLVSVQLSVMDDSARSDIMNYRIDDLVRSITLDARYYGVNTMPEDELLSIITNAASLEILSLDDDQVSIVADVLKAYFRSDAVDILINSDTVIDDVVSDLILRSTEATPSKAVIAAVLYQRIPTRYYVDDPEAVEFTAISLYGLIREERQKAKVTLVTDNILELASDIPKENVTAFQSDVYGSCWVLVEDYAGIPVDVSPSNALVNDSSGDVESYSITQTGMPIIFKKLDSSILKSQALSLLVAFVLIFILLGFRFHSLTGGLIALVPIATTILCNFTLMVALDVPLDVVSVLIGSVAVGIGIDYTIHFMTRFQREFKECQLANTALRITLQTTGKAILINAASVMTGFLVLVLGNIVPMQRFGYLVAVTMLTSAVASITLLPALILVTKASFIGELDRVAEGIRQKANGIKSLVNNGSQSRQHRGSR